MASSIAPVECDKDHLDDHILSDVSICYGIDCAVFKYSDISVLTGEQSSLYN